VANPVLDKFFQDRFGGQNPFTGAQLGGAPSPEPNPWAGGMGAINMPGPGFPGQGPQGQGEPPWVTRARQQRKMGRPGMDPNMPPQQPGGPAPMPPPDPNLAQFNQGPRQPGGLPGGYGGIMGGQGVRPPKPPLQRSPMGPAPTQPPKLPRDPNDVYGKTPGGGF
jgi:hypothetical protein